MQAVLFDMDGTLVDSEKLWDISLAALYEQLGGRLTAQVRTSMVGGSAQDTITDGSLGESNVSVSVGSVPAEGSKSRHSHGTSVVGTTTHAGQVMPRNALVSHDPIALPVDAPWRPMTLSLPTAE